MIGGMDIATIRLHNLKTLIERHRQRPEQARLPRHGQLTRFATSAAANPRYLGHLLARRKNIGDMTARDLETKLGLAFGWMDQVHQTAPAAGGRGDDSLDSLSPDEAQLLRSVLKLFRRDPLAVQGALLAMAAG